MDPSSLVVEPPDEKAQPKQPAERARREDRRGDRERDPAGRLYFSAFPTMLREDVRLPGRPFTFEAGTADHRWTR